MKKDFLTNIVAALDKQKTMRQLKKDLKELEALSIQLEGKLTLNPDSRKQILGQVRQLIAQVNALQANVHVRCTVTEEIREAVSKALEISRLQADAAPITVKIEVKKDAVIKQLRELNQQYASLLSDQSLSKKYNELLNSAASASDIPQLNVAQTYINKFANGLIDSDLKRIGDQIHSLDSAIKQINSMPIDAGNEIAILNKIGESTKGLTDENLKLLLSQEKLDLKQKKLILRTHGLSDAEIQAKLEKLGLVTASKAHVAAAAQETVSTNLLSTALTNLKLSALSTWSAVKSAFLNNPIGIGIMAVTAFIPAVTSAISKHKQAAEEIRRGNIAQAEAAAQTADRLTKLSYEYQRLSEIQDRTSSEEEALKTTAEELNEVLGERARTLDTLTAGTEAYTAALKEAAKEKLLELQAEAGAGRLSAEQELKSAALGLTGSKVKISLNPLAEESGSYQAALRLVREQFSSFEKKEAFGASWDFLNASSGFYSPEQLVEYYYALKEAKQKVILESQKNGDDSLLKTAVYRDIEAAIQKLRDAAENYTSARYQELLGMYRSSNELPDTMEDFKAMEASILQAGDAEQRFQEVIQSMLAQDFSSLFQNLDQAAQKSEAAASGAEQFLQAPFNRQEMISAIHDLSGGFESLDKIFQSFSGEPPFDFTLLDDETFLDTFSGLGDAYTDFIAQLTDSPNDIKACCSAFDTLLGTWLNSTDILEHVSEENAGLTEAMLTQMGVANAEEIVTEALAHNQEKLAAWKYYTANASFDLAAASEEAARGFFNEAENAGISKNTLFDLMTAKVFCNESAVVTDRDIQALINLAEAAGIAEASIENAKAALSAKNTPGVVRSDGAERAITTSIVDNLNNAPRKERYSPKKYTYPSRNTSNSSSSPASSSPAQPSIKEINWLNNALEHMAKTNDRIREQTEKETLSYQNRLLLVRELTAHDQQELNTIQEAAKRRNESWEETRQKILSVFGEIEGNAFMTRIMEGDTSKEGWNTAFDISDASGKEKADLLEKAQSAWNAYEDLTKKAAEKEKKLFEDKQKEFELRINHIKEMISEVSDAIDDIESNMSIKETSGRMVTEADYEALIDLSREQIELYEEQRSVLEEQLHEVEDNSAEWYSIQSQIAGCNASINDCLESQEKWNQEILNLPVRRVERYLELLEHIKRDISNYISEQDSLGIQATKEQLQELFSLSEEQMEKLKEEHVLLTKRLPDYEYGSDKFNEISADIQDTEDDISSLIQYMADLNAKMLQLPVTRLDELTGRLEQVKSAVSDVSAQWDTAIQAVTDLLDHQIDKLNEEKELTEETYQKRIDPIKEQLELMQQVSEEEERQPNLEKAQLALQRAESQAINKVLRNGTWEYAADDDAVRDARKELKNAEEEITKADLQDKINALEEERDAALKNLDAELEALNERSEKWQELTHSVEEYITAAKAAETLGAGWQEKILSGNDDALFQTAKDTWKNLAVLTDQYETQIAANEKISALMQQYADEYQKGNLTFAEVSAKFDALTRAAQDGFSAQEHLDAVLQLSKDKSVQSALLQIQEQTGEAYRDFQSYLASVNQNQEVIARYTQTWEDIKRAVTEQLEVLKKLAEEEAKKVNSSNSSSKSSSKKGSSSSAKGPNWNTPDTEPTGPAKEENRADIVRQSQEKKNKKNQASGPAMEAYKAGLENGPVGSGKTFTASEEVRIMEALGLEEIKPGEHPIMAHLGELVFNEEQISMAAKNYKRALHFQPYSNALPLQTADASTHITNRFGEIHITEAQNITDICHGIMNGGLDQAITQALRRRT